MNLSVSQISCLSRQDAEDEMLAAEFVCCVSYHTGAVQAGISGEGQALSFFILLTLLNTYCEAKEITGQTQIRYRHNHHKNRQT